MESVLFFFADYPVYSYGFMLGLGLLFGSLLAQREGKRKGFGSETVFRFIVWVALVFVVAGRVAFVFSIHRWHTFIYPWVLFTGVQLNEKVGCAAAVCYAMYYIIRYIPNPAGFLDVIIPSVALMQSLGHLGSNVFGRQTSQPWAVTFGQFSLHPIQLYAAILYYLLFALLWQFRRTTRFDGQLVTGYLALNAGIQWFLLRFREISGESPNPWLYALAALFFGGAWLYLYASAPKNSGRRRRGAWSSIVASIVSILGVILIMTAFFFWRYS